MRARVVQFSPLAQGAGPGRDRRGRARGRDFAPERQSETSTFSGPGGSSSHASGGAAGDHRLLVGGRAGTSEGAVLEDQGLSDLRLIEDARNIEGGGFAGKSGTEARFSAPLHLAVWPLEQGFTGGGIAVISEQDVLGDRLIKPHRKKRGRAENYLTEAQTLSPGDLVVHVDHGVGRYKGSRRSRRWARRMNASRWNTRAATGSTCPVENIELLSRYGHEEGLLDRLGGGAWQAKKAQAQGTHPRDGRQAHPHRRRAGAAQGPGPRAPRRHVGGVQRPLPLRETDDQLSAIADVLEDLERGRPMDRLVWAMWASARPRSPCARPLSRPQGLQVAVIAPTTLLARQHAKTFADRFRGFPVNVRQLSRFVPQKEAAKTREGHGRRRGRYRHRHPCAAGQGHPVPEPRASGHRRGTALRRGHKERLKELRSDVHVLTLTATPIPRTLQMSLSGVRDLSMIGTPPVDRLAIRTYVSEFDAVTIREALLREHYRGGQSFYVVPRIEDLPGLEEFLREQVPEVSFVTAHGQMAAGELDDRMNAFYDGKYDVLLATTIVESGIDIPTANTMVIHRADMFGLAQLYQIRGRVGRAKTRAYAYLTTKPRAKLTPAAEKRLRVLGSLDSLGAGFTIASQDLDIRGAGNLVGEEQSGHVREVGFELYQSMLEEAIAKIRSGEAEGLPGDDGQWSPQINLGVPVLIPEALRARSRRAAGPLPAAEPAGIESRPRRLRRRADRPLRQAPAGGQHAAAGGADQGHVQARPYRQARCRPQGRDDPVPQRQVPQSPKGWWSSFRPERAGEGQGQQDRRAPRLGGEADKIKGAFAIARDLAQHARA
jgi:transcription-repair coupling factor (superfamily II helicase)